MSREYREATHVEYNLNYKQCKTIPVIFNNLRMQDGRCIIIKLRKFKDHGIFVIAFSMELYTFN